MTDTDDEVDGLSPVAQDFVKAIWSATEWGGQPSTTTALARRFGTSPASVTDTLKRLAGQGLVDHTPYRPVTLTRRGERLAVAMVRRHRLLETFLVRVLDYGWDEVHDEAERLEHAVSDTLIERMDLMLGHPAADPHGDPIPSSEGRTVSPDGTVLLADAGAGSWHVIRVADADPEVLVAAEGIGMTPGAVIETDGSGGIRIGSDPVEVEDRVARAVRVAPTS